MTNNVYRYYQTRHPYSHAIGEHVSSPAGFDARIVPPMYLLPGVALVYGILRGTGNIIRQCEQKHRDFLYIDHSFFTDHRGTPGDNNPSTYFRIIANNRYFNPITPLSSDRVDKLNITVKPWKKHGKYIVIAPMSRFVAEFEGLDCDKWLEQTISTLSEVTDRPIMIKDKYTKSMDPTIAQDITFAESIADAHAVVCAGSNCAVDAILEGIPVFTLTEN